MNLSNEQGKLLLDMARTAIRVRLNSTNDNSFSKDYTEYEKRFNNLINIVLKQNNLKKDDLPEFLNEARGVFVTINKGINLRGCIGLPETEKPLYDAIVEAAVGAAFGDPRFPRLQKDEFDIVTLEVSVLTVPKKESNTVAEEFLTNFKLGTDGIVIRGEYGSALLLPQVAREHAMDKIEFLEAVSIKAGLKADDWMNRNSELFKFQAQVFKECEYNPKA